MKIPHRVSDKTVFTRLSGFQLFLGQPSEFPLLQRNHLVLQPGLGHSIQVSASHISTNTDPAPLGNLLTGDHPCSGTGSWPLSMKSLSPSKRGCRFPEESETLSFHKNYSRTSCVFECGLKRAKDELQCIPWYLPQLAGVMPCRF